METEFISTPFGGGSMTLGMLASQYDVAELDPDATIDKWKLFRALCEARPLLGVTDRGLAVLNALLTFYPGNALSSSSGLVVFPSNAQLALRAHGIAPATLRRHLAALVDANLLIRRDSPNGKRYARRGSEGQIEQAFGFSIAPLIARAEEIERLAAVVTAERLQLRLLKERMTLCRRDLAKLIEAAMEEGVPGDWIGTLEHFRSLVARIPRSPVAGELDAILDEMLMLREEVLNILEIKVKSKINSANESQNERHIQNSNPHLNSDLEPAFEGKQTENPEIGENTAADREDNILPVQVMPIRMARVDGSQQALKAFPLGFVLRACPEISMYGPSGAISSWRDMMAAGVVVRSMLGVSPSAYERACEVMGPENTATIMACVLERAGHIHSAGGYLRDLTRRAEKGEFAIGPMLMSLARASGEEGRRSA